MSQTATAPVPPAAYIDAPRDAELIALHAYWRSRCGARAMPARADIRPADIKSLLPHVMLWSVEASGEPFLVRLVGEAIVRFVGANHTGRPATATMPPEAAAGMLAVLDEIVRAREARFRVGKAYWAQHKNYRDFEACFLPLSADGANVNMILGGLRFDTK